MCGILGSINFPLDRTALDSIRHRGPDGEGLTEHTCGSHRVILGHRRLAIVDLSEHGAQPMATVDGSCHIVFNGEIYNHLSIKNELSGPFRGHSDTETLLEALAKFGIDAVKRLNGIFSFAYFDQKRCKLYLARDPFGVKPLYYCALPRQFCFASEIAPLRQLADNSLDAVALASLLKLRFVPSPRTLSRGIRRLRPGHILEIDMGGDTLSFNEYPYIGPNLLERKARPNFEAAVKEYGYFFEQAVSRQLMADVEIGVLLSGGVDSALVAACVQKFSDRPLKAFTVGFTDAAESNVDETEAARVTADFLRMEHHVTKIGFDDFIQTLKECVRIVEEPLATTSIVPMHFLAKLASSHVKVVMSGQGADELLGGYNRYQVELWQKWVPAILARVGSNFSKSLSIKNDTVVRGLRALQEGNELSRFLTAYAMFSDDEIARLTGITTGREIDDIAYYYDLLGCSSLASSVERMMALDTRLGLADDLLLYTDKITMRESLECRVPFLDPDLVSYTESLPARYKLTVGKSKIVHSAYARQKLPAALVSRPKKGFLSPTQVWFKDGEKLNSLLLQPRSNFANHFDLKAVEDIICEHRQGYNRERQIFLLLCLSFHLNTD